MFISCRCIRMQCWSLTASQSVDYCIVFHSTAAPSLVCLYSYATRFTTTTTTTPMAMATLADIQTTMTPSTKWKRTQYISRRTTNLAYVLWRHFVGTVWWQQCQLP